MIDITLSGLPSDPPRRSDESTIFASPGVLCQEQEGCGIEKYRSVYSLMKRNNITDGDVDLGKRGNGQHGSPRGKRRNPVRVECTHELNDAAATNALDGTADD